VLHAKLRNTTCQGLNRQGQRQRQGLTSLIILAWNSQCSAATWRMIKSTAIIKTFKILW